MVRGNKPKNSCIKRKCNTSPTEYVSKRNRKVNDKPEIIRNSNKTKDQVSEKQTVFNHEQLTDKTKIIATKPKMITVNGAIQLPRPIVESSFSAVDKCKKHLECTENALVQYGNNNTKGINRIDINRKKCTNSNKKRIEKSKNNEVETYDFIPQASVFVHILSAFISQTFEYGLKNLNSIKITSHIPTKRKVNKANNFARSAFTLLLKSLHSSAYSRTPLKSKALDYHHTKGHSQTPNYSVSTGREKKKTRKAFTKNNSHKEPDKVYKKSWKTNIENDTIVNSFPNALNEPISFPRGNDIIFEKRDVKQCNKEMLLILENMNFNKNLLLMYKGQDLPRNEIEETYEITRIKDGLEEKHHEPSRTGDIQEIEMETHRNKDYYEPNNTAHSLRNRHSSKNSPVEEITENCEILAALPKDVYHSISAREELVESSLNSKHALKLVNINQNQQNYHKVRQNKAPSPISNREIFENVEAEEMTKWIENIPAYNIDNSIKTLYVRKRPARCRDHKNVSKANKHHIEMGRFRKEVISFLIQNTFKEREKCYTTYFEEKKMVLDSVDEEPMSLKLPSIKLRMPKFSQFMPEIGTAIKDQMKKFLTNNMCKYHDMSLGDHNFKRDSECSYQKSFLN